jgi:hypothetical protein
MEDVPREEAKAHILFLHNPLSLRSDMTAPDYADVVTKYQETAHSFPEAVDGAPDQFEFAEVVNFEFSRLLKHRSANELKAGRDALINYGTDLRVQFMADKLNPDTNGYMDWMSKLRILAGHSTQMQPSVYNIPREDGQVLNSKRDFWQPIYSASAFTETHKEQLKKYLFAEGMYIENLSTTFLDNLLKNIDQYGFEGIFFDEPFVQNPEVLGQGSTAIINEVIGQAATSGWENAKVLKANLDNLLSLGTSNGRTLIPRLGNIATDRINSMIRGTFSYLEEDDSTEAPWAIKRIADLIFMGERAPAGKSSVNYLQMSGLAQRMLNQVALLPEVHLQFRRSTD